MINPRWFNQEADTAQDGLSVLDLVNSGTIDCKLAGLLWVIMEQRASVMVAAGPSYAGKTTLLHALLDFLPPDLERVDLQGYYEDFSFLSFSPPDKTYMIAEEISNHGFAEYLWGQKAIRTLKLVSQGYALGATMHARNSQELIYILNKYLGLSLPLLTRLGIVVNLKAYMAPNAGYYDEPIRRVTSVELILPDPEGLAIQVLAARNNTENGFEYQAEKTLQKALDDKKLSGKNCVSAEIDTRMRFLRHLLKNKQTSRREVRQSILEFYRTRHSR
jgi:hypothetical protein